MQNTIKDIIKQSRSIVVDFAVQQPNIGSGQNLIKLLDYFDKQNHTLLKEQDKIQQVLEMLSDDASKQRYCNYFKYLLLCKINLQLAWQHDPNYSIELASEMLQNFPEVLRKNGFTPPNIKYQKSMERWVSMSILCTFGMQQYIYPEQVEVNSNDVFIDCGGFLGETAIWAHQKGAQVYSFEPISDTFQYLKDNFVSNGLELKHAFNLGVSDKNQQVVFKLPLENTAGAFIDKQEGNCAHQNHFTQLVDYNVTCVRIDDWLQENNVKATFIKMDIEGAELDALRGAAQTICI